jgi:hypothetical protein
VPREHKIRYFARLRVYLAGGVPPRFGQLVKREPPPPKKTRVSAPCSGCGSGL